MIEIQVETMTWTFYLKCQLMGLRVWGDPLQVLTSCQWFEMNGDWKGKSAQWRVDEVPDTRPELAICKTFLTSLSCVLTSLVLFSYFQIDTFSSTSKNKKCTPGLERWLGKCLLHHHEFMSSDPQHPHKKPGAACNLSSGGVDTGASLGCPGLPVQ